MEADSLQRLERHSLVRDESWNPTLRCPLLFLLLVRSTTRYGMTMSCKREPDIPPVLLLTRSLLRDAQPDGTTLIYIDR